MTVIIKKIKVNHLGFKGVPQFKAFYLKFKITWSIKTLSCCNSNILCCMTMMGNKFSGNDPRQVGPIKYT